MATEVPCMQFNLVVYKEKGRKLDKPLFYENVYIYNADNYLYAYDSDKFKAFQEDYNECGHDDPIVEIIQQVIGTDFKYCGIWVNGLEWDIDDGQVIHHHQQWLLTNLTKEDLEKESYYG